MRRAAVVDERNKATHEVVVENEAVVLVDDNFRRSAGAFAVRSIEIFRFEAL